MIDKLNQLEIRIKSLEKALNLGFCEKCQSHTKTIEKSTRPQGFQAEVKSYDVIRCCSQCGSKIE